MDKRVKDIDFQKVDWSKYQDQIDCIYKTYNELKKIKSLLNY